MSAKHEPWEGGQIRGHYPLKRHQILGPGASLAMSTPLRTERPVLTVGGRGGHSQSFARLISSRLLVEMRARGNLM